LETTYILAFVLLIVAFFYASVGHGGASGYLAMMSLFGVASIEMKTSALILNIGVSAISFYHFYKEGHFDFKFFLPFAVVSMPMAFLGACYPISDLLYKKLLGLCLLFPILKLSGMLDFILKSKNEKRNPHALYITHYALFIGASIGFLSGMLGIGGGIILSPVVLLLGWADMKKTAATSAIAGFVGAYQKGILISENMYFWLLSAIFGGILGGYFGSKRFNISTLKYILAFVLLIASVKLIVS
jgi:uncharacterized protein